MYSAYVLILFQNIVLCNVGQATGLVKNDILNLFQELPSITLKKFIAEKGESHSFLVFENVDSAAMFFNEYNGKKCLDNNAFLYMYYVDNGKYLLISYSSKIEICKVIDELKLHCD